MLRSAANYLNNMNRRANPCSDFYSFACGRYAENRVVPEHAKKVTVLNDMKKDLDLHLKGILENSPRKNATKAMALALTYYDSCMNEVAQNDMGALPLLSLVSQMGGWEMLTNARFDSADYHWEALAGQLATIGVDGLIKVFVHNSFEDSDKQMLMFCPPKLFLEKKKFYRGAPSSNIFLSYYREYIQNLLQLLGVDMEDDGGVIDFQVNDIIDVERRIANLTRTDSPRNHSIINNLITFGDFRKSYPDIRWDLFFNEELKESLGPLDDGAMVNVLDVGYFDGLSALVKSKPLRSVSIRQTIKKSQFLESFNLNSLSSINNYMMWRLVSTFDVYLPQQYRVPAQKFHANMYGATADVPQWENCVREVSENLAMPLSTAYASSYFSTEDREKAEEMIVDLKRSMERLLHEAEWMDDTTRSAALKKLEKMGHKIGFPDALLNDSAVLAPFEGVHMTNNRYFDNAVQLKKAAVRYVLSRLQNPPPKEEWASPVIAVDAFHYFTGNEIIFPAAILQFPMFVPEAPFYVNYGAIGLGIGHEITHGYDDLGAQYDDLGNLRMWWNFDTMETFLKKRQCFINQYSNHFEPITQRSVDGRLTIGENIADNGGLRVAYEAYRMRSLRETDSPALPGLSAFSPEQLFFVAYANTWCEAVKTSSINYLMDTDVHALGMFRVNVPLQNFPAFSEAFQCPSGSPMNPYEKCRIW
ncbi:peptidase family M13 [Oesophagostomum dentatum]|uniref:Peptidase family M13 n=1 Tax=Oesophagostomum dentatum TaxID=61180 RepID=A0A0B1TSG4_OESDE|nr:peptidase family M13 [Oesophagostomum dentatum]